MGCGSAAQDHLAHGCEMRLSRRWLAQRRRSRHRRCGRLCLALSRKAIRSLHFVVRRQGRILALGVLAAALAGSCSVGTGERGRHRGACDGGRRGGGSRSVTMKQLC
jgi:hypothetical protein